MPNDGAYAVVGTFDVYLNHAVEVFLGRALDGADMRDSGAVDKDVNAIAVEKFLEPGVHAMLVGHIAELSRGGAASGRDPLAGRDRSGFVHVENANHRALRREFQSNGLPNTAAAAGDHGDFAVQAEIPRVCVWIDQSETPRFQGMKSS